MNGFLNAMFWVYFNKIIMKYLKRFTIKERIISCIGNVKRNKIHIVVGCHQSYVSMIHTSLGILPEKKFIYNKSTGRRASKTPLEKSIRKKFKPSW